MFSTIYQMRARRYFSKQKISTAWSSFKSLTKLQSLLSLKRKKQKQLEKQLVNYQGRWHLKVPLRSKANESRKSFNKNIIMSERKFPGRDPGSMKMIEHLYNKVPAFNDVFDEETFYLFVMIFVAGTLLVAYIGSRFITIKPVD